MNSTSPSSEKEKITIEQCYALWIHDPEEGEKLMMKAEPNWVRREKLLKGFANIRKKQVNKEKVPNWWK